MNEQDVWQVINFFSKVFSLTVQGWLDWNETADEETLLASLGQGYTVRLSLVADLEGKSPEPDHTLVLYEGSKSLLTVSRTSAGIDEWAMENGFDGSYSLMLRLWEMAQYKASNISKHLDAANSLLDQIALDRENG